MGLSYQYVTWVFKLKKIFIVFFVVVEIYFLKRLLSMYLS